MSAFTDSPIALYDTLLRDGSQMEGIAFSLQDKITVARRLDSLGIHYVEGGFPGSNEKDKAFFEQMKSQPLGARQTGRLRRHSQARLQR